MNVLDPKLFRKCFDGFPFLGEGTLDLLLDDADLLSLPLSERLQVSLCLMACLLEVQLELSDLRIFAV